MKKQNMLENHPGKTLLFFAIPMIIGNLFQQFYNLIDSAIVGKFVGEDALASVGASYAITNVFIAIAIGGGIGSSVIISQHLGAGNLSKMKTAVYTALFNFLGVSIVLGILGTFLNTQILEWMNTPADVFENAKIYLGIYFYGLPFLFMYNILASIFNALGDSKTPLNLLIFSSLLNIGLDLCFVIAFNGGVAGVAVATLIAQGVSAVVSFILLLRRLKTYESEAAPALYNGGLSVSMVKVAIPSILQQSIVFVGMLLVQVVVNGFGSSALAGFTAGMRIETICIVPMIATGNAMSAFTAQNLGARQVKRVKQGYRACYMIVGVLAASMCLILQLYGNTFLNAFLDSSAGTEAFSVASAYVSFQSFFYIFIGLKSVTDGVLRGAGDMVVFTLANLINLSIRVFVAYYFAASWGIAAVWIAVPIGWFANYAISFIRYLTGKWSRIQLV